jgi:hypothetical protein
MQEFELRSAFELVIKYQGQVQAKIHPASVKVSKSSVTLDFRKPQLGHL